MEWPPLEWPHSRTLDHSLNLDHDVALELTMGRVGFHNFVSSHFFCGKRAFSAYVGMHARTRPSAHLRRGNAAF